MVMERKVKCGLWSLDEVKGSWVVMLEILDGFSWDDNGKRRISRGIKSKVLCFWKFYSLTWVLESIILSCEKPKNYERLNLKVLQNLMKS